ncbi:MAG: hypothetical protein Q9214_006987, partial [Letrouitia sp. 1 TL-2023]
MYFSPFIFLLSALGTITTTALANPTITSLPTPIFDDIATTVVDVSSTSALALPQKSNVPLNGQVPFNLTNCQESLFVKTSCGNSTNRDPITLDSCVTSIADVPDTPELLPVDHFVRYYRHEHSSCEVFFRYQGSLALEVNWPVVKTQWLPQLLRQCPSNTDTRAT